MIQTQKEGSLSYSNKTIQQSIQPQNQRIVLCNIFSFFHSHKKKNKNNQTQTKTNTAAAIDDRVEVKLCEHLRGPRDPVV